MERRTQEEIKEQAGNDMIILLENWKKNRRKRRFYRAGVGVFLLISCLVLLAIGYISLDGKIPSIIRIKAGTEHYLNLRVPMTADVSAVVGQEKSNIPQNAITVNLSEPVTLKADNLNQFQMKVKLFGWIPFKQVNIEVIEEQELIPMGIPVGIYVETDGILVIGTGEFVGADGVTCSPAAYILKSGDYIRKLNGEAVSDKDTFIDEINRCNGAELILTIERDSQIMNVKIKPAKNQSGEYKIGAWIRDNAQGVGTMTFMDGNGNFGALGHGINDVDTSTLMEMDGGTLYQTQIVAINKGEKGNPGEMTGMIIYSRDRILGEVTANNERGIFGVCNEKAKDLISEEPLPIGLKQDIVCGPAKIRCTVEDEPKYYTVEILAVHLDHDNVNRGIELKVTDKDLIEVTGGIVQGMSGSPILQNGKIIGAVTHVLISDPTRGYGIFIENMLSAS